MTDFDAFYQGAISAPKGPEDEDENSFDAFYDKTVNKPKGLFDRDPMEYITTPLKAPGELRDLAIGGLSYSVGGLLGLVGTAGFEPDFEKSPKLEKYLKDKAFRTRLQTLRDPEPARETAELEVEYQAYQRAIKEQTSELGLVKAGERLAKFGSEEIRKTKKEGILPEVIQDAAVSIPTTLLALTTSYATKSPSIGMAIAGSAAAGARYQSLIDEGYEVETAQKAAAVSGVAEALTERLPIEALLKTMRGPLWGKVLKRIGAEGLQEGLVEAIETAYDTGMLGEDVSISEALKKIGYASVVGMIASSPIVVPTSVIESKVEKKLTEDLSKELGIDPDKARKERLQKLREADKEPVIEPTPRLQKIQELDALIESTQDADVVKSLQSRKKDLINLDTLESDISKLEQEMSTVENPEVRAAYEQALAKKKKSKAILNKKVEKHEQKFGLKLKDPSTALVHVKQPQGEERIVLPPTVSKEEPVPITLEGQAKVPPIAVRLWEILPDGETRQALKGIDDNTDKVIMTRPEQTDKDNSFILVGPNAPKVALRVAGLRKTNDRPRRYAVPRGKVEPVRQALRALQETPDTPPSAPKVPPKGPLKGRRVAEQRDTPFDDYSKMSNERLLKLYQNLSRRQVEETNEEQVDLIGVEADVVAHELAKRGIDPIEKVVPVAPEETPVKQEPRKLRDYRGMGTDRLKQLYKETFRRYQTADNDAIPDVQKNLADLELELKRRDKDFNAVKLHEEVLAEGKANLPARTIESLRKERDNLHHQIQREDISEAEREDLTLRRDNLDQQISERTEKHPSKFRVDDDKKLEQRDQEREQEIVPEGFYSKLREVIDRKIPKRIKLSELINLLKSWEVQNLFKPDELKWSGLIPVLENIHSDNLKYKKEGNTALAEVLETLSKEEVLNLLESTRPQILIDVRNDVDAPRKEAKLRKLKKEKEKNIAEAVKIVEQREVAYDALIGIIEDETTAPIWRVISPSGRRNPSYSELEQFILKEENKTRFPRGFKLAQEIVRSEKRRQELENDREFLSMNINVLSRAFNTKFHSTNVTPGGTNYQEILIRMPSIQIGFVHWNVPDVLIHVRTTDRTTDDGKKILYVEEVQSDLHQSGKKYGYEGKPLTELPRDFELKPKESTLRDVLDGVRLWHVYHRGHFLDTIAVPGELSFATAKKQFLKSLATMPQAPFEGSRKWAMLAMKKIIHMAAVGGYDGVGITTGTDQASMNKKIHDPEKAEFYMHLYDRVIPQEVGSYIKQWGAKVETNGASISYSTPTRRGTKPIHFFPITPEMKSSVTTRGQPLFQTDAAIADLEIAKTPSGWEVTLPANARSNPVGEALLFTGKTRQEALDKALTNLQSTFSLRQRALSKEEVYILKPLVESRDVNKILDYIAKKDEIAALFLEGMKKSFSINPISINTANEESANLMGMSRSTRALILFPAGTEPFTIFFRDENSLFTGLNSMTMFHELLHGATAGNIIGVQDGVISANSPTGRAVRELMHLTAQIKEAAKLNSMSNNVHPAVQFSLNGANIFQNELEIIAWGLSSPQVRDFLRKTTVGPLKAKTLWERFLDAIAKVFGVKLTPKNRNAFEALMDITGRIMEPTGAPQHDPLNPQYRAWEQRDPTPVNPRDTEVSEDTRTITGKAYDLGADFFRGTARTLNKMGTPVAKELGQAIITHIDTAQRNLGIFNRHLVPVIRRINELTPKERGALEEGYHNYWALRQQGKKNEALDVLENGHNELVSLVEATRNALDEIGDVMVKMGVKVYNPVTGEYTPFVKRSDYFPNILRPEFKNALVKAKNKDGEYTKDFKDLADILIDNKYKVDGKEITDYKQAEKYIQQVSRDGVFETGFLGNIEMSRTSPFPQEAYDTTLHAIQKYRNGVAERLAQIEAYGQKTDENNQDIFDRAIAEQKGSPNAVYIARVRNSIYGSELTAVDTLMQIGSTLATGLQLPGPRSVLTNLLGGIGHAHTAFDFDAMVKAWYELMQSDQREVYKELMFNLGIITDDFFRMVADLESMGISNYRGLEAVKRGVSAFTGEMMTFTRTRVPFTNIRPLRALSFNASEMFVRQLSGIAAIHQIRSQMESYAADPDSRVSKVLKKFAEDEGINLDTLAKEPGLFETSEIMNSPQMSKAIRRLVNIAQGSYRIDRNPRYVETSFGKFLLKYSKYTTQLSDFFDRIVIENIRSKDKDLQLEGAKNFFKFVGYFGATSATNAYFVYKMFGYTVLPTAEEFIKVFMRAMEDDDEEENMNAAAYLMRATFDLYQSMGAFGLISYGWEKYEQWNERGTHVLTAAPIVPILNTWNSIMRGIAGREHVTFKSAVKDTTDFFIDQMAVLRQWKNIFGEATGEKNVIFNRHTINLAREATRRFADSNPNVEIADPMDKRYTRFGILNRRIYEALLVGNAKEAERLYLEAEGKMKTYGDLDSLQKSVEASMKARRPFAFSGKPGGHAGRIMFEEWAQKNLPTKDYVRMKELDERFMSAAQEAGLVKSILPRDEIRSLIEFQRGLEPRD